jgi:hypothetical protein
VVMMMIVGTTRDDDLPLSTGCQRSTGSGRPCRTSTSRPRGRG